MLNFIQRVVQFNRDLLGVEPPGLPLNFMEQDHKWMVMALREEAGELEGSHHVVDQVDALVDSIVFSIGGLFKLGLTETQMNDCMMAVMDANFQKKAGKNPNRPVEGVKDGYKPEGWVGPEERIRSILNVR